MSKKYNYVYKDEESFREIYREVDDLGFSGQLSRDQMKAYEDLCSQRLEFLRQHRPEYLKQLNSDPNAMLLMLEG